MQNIIQRCNNPKVPCYHAYGGRGIRVYGPWLKGRKGRGDFLAYLVSLKGHDNPALQIDRRDVDKGYEPGNIRFITLKRNMGNRRSIRALQQRVHDLETRLRSYERGAT